MQKTLVTYLQIIPNIRVHMIEQISSIEDNKSGWITGLQSNQSLLSCEGIGQKLQITITKYPKD
jgi:hypothetical protein